MKKLPKFATNFYFLVSVFFFFWMVFIDSNDLYSQYRLKKKLGELEKEKVFFERQIEEVKHEREALLNNDELLEKFAREKYLMKKKTEDIYVIVESKD